MGDDQIAVLVEEKKAIAVRDQESIGPALLAGAGSCLKRLPEAIARGCLQAAQLAIAAHAIDIIVLEIGRPAHAVQASPQSRHPSSPFPFPQPGATRLPPIQ